MQKLSDFWWTGQIGRGQKEDRDALVGAANIFYRERFVRDGLEQWSGGRRCSCSLGESDCNEKQEQWDQFETGRIQRDRTSQISNVTCLFSGIISSNGAHPPSYKIRAIDPKLFLQCDFY